MMPRWLAVCALVGCGRLQFDARADGSSGYRKHVVIDHARVAGDLVDFPVLVDVTDPALAMAARSDGHDIVFVGGATQLDQEVERYDAAVGRLIAWVRVPALGATTDTTLDLVAGDPSFVDPQHAVGVWSNGFVAVWHLGEDPSGAAPQIHDSTANGVHGVMSGAMIATQQTAGRIAGSLDMDGVDDNIDFGTTSLLDAGAGSFTLSMWVLVTTTTGMFDSPFKKGGSSPACRGFNIQLGSGLWTAHVTDGVTSLAPRFSTTPLTDQWVYLAEVLTVAEGKFEAYVNGTLAATTSTAGFGSATSSLPAGIGGAGDGCTAATPFRGQVDEVRIGAPRTAAWLATEAANQATPEQFARLVP